MKLALMVVVWPRLTVDEAAAFDDVGATKKLAAVIVLVGDKVRIAVPFVAGTGEPSTRKFAPLLLNTKLLRPDKLRVLVVEPAFGVRRNAPVSVKAPPLPTIDPVTLLV